MTTYAIESLKHGITAPILTRHGETPSLTEAHVLAAIIAKQETTAFSVYVLEETEPDRCDRCKVPTKHSAPRELGAVASLKSRLCPACRAHVVA